MRTRVFRDSLTQQAVPCTYIEPGYVTNTTADVRNQDYEIMFDVVTLEFEKLKAQGNLIFNPMMRYRKTYTMTEIPFVSVGGTKSGVTLQGGYAHNNRIPLTLNYPVTGAEISAAFSGWTSKSDAAIAEAFANIDQSELLLGASLGELPESVKWLTSLLRRFIRLLKAFLKKKALITLAKTIGNLSPGKASKEISDLWLEFRYAVRPLIFEAESALNAFKKHIALGKRFTARGFSQDSSESTSTESYNVGWNGWATLTWSKTHTESYEARAGCLYIIHLTDERDWGVILGLDRPISTVWELTPFSFVIDWFLSIGNVLAMWEQNPSLVVEGAWCTQSWKIEDTCSLTSAVKDSSWVSPYADITMTTTPGTAKQVEYLHYRNVDINKPVFPSVDVNLDLAKLLDLAALARTLWGRR